MLFNFIPVQYRVMAAVIAVGVAMTLAGTAGWVVNGFRLDAKYAKQIAVKQAQITDLQSAINVQNTAVAVMGANTEGAYRAQALAEKNAKDWAAVAKQRETKADNLKATNCRDMLENLKGVYQDESFNPYFDLNPLYIVRM